MADDLPFKRARSLVYYPVPPDWVPSPEEKVWLTEVEDLTEEERNQLARFDAGTPSDWKVWDDKRQTWVPGNKV